MQTPPEQTNDGSPKQLRPIIFLDIDGVLNTTKHNTQIHLEKHLVKQLKNIVEASDALIVLTTFWRHFHEYITYVLHRHGIDVGRHMLPLPMGSTRGKQCTKNFLHFHRVKQQESGYCQDDENAVTVKKNSMIGRSAEDEGEYSSRAEEIEAWLEMYGDQYLGSKMDGSCGKDWKYVILDDRPSAAKPNTPSFDRFVFTDTKIGLTEEDSEKAIQLLMFGP
ncbi:hypothetical protein ACHAXR_008671 [Thalassiosira sp. AJA248-18]